MLFTDEFQASHIDVTINAIHNLSHSVSIFINILSTFWNNDLSIILRNINSIEIQWNRSKHPIQWKSKSPSFIYILPLLLLLLSFQNFPDLFNLSKSVFPFSIKLKSLDYAIVSWSIRENSVGPSRACIKSLHARRSRKIRNCFARLHIADCLPICSVCRCLRSVCWKYRPFFPRLEDFFIRWKNVFSVEFICR